MPWSLLSASKMPVVEQSVPVHLSPGSWVEAVPIDVTELACPGGQRRQKDPRKFEELAGFLLFGLVIAWNKIKYLVFKFKRSQPVRRDPWAQTFRIGGPERKVGKPLSRSRRLIASLPRTRAATSGQRREEHAARRPRPVCALIRFRRPPRLTPAKPCEKFCSN